MTCEVMGILNVTPDSFSDGGAWPTPADAVRRGRRMFEDGAVVVDVGGESTRPGAEPVTVDEELRRTIPVIEELSEFGRVSVDTRHAEVAVAAVRAGASIINDVSAALDGVAADLGVGWIAMHMRGTPPTMQRDTRYGDVVAEVREFLLGCARRARDAGVARIWIDPGLGFGKSTEQNLQLVRGIPELVRTGFPVLVGASRKNFIGVICDERDPRLRGPGSLAVAVESVRRGAAMLRVHDVRETVGAVRVATALAAQPVEVPS